MIDFSAYVKYSRPGPRYTSYPTAPEFSDKFSYEAYIKELENRDKKSCSESTAFALFTLAILQK